jgi:hypothetical protein
MNDPWNRLWRPSAAPFGGNFGPSAAPPSPSGGILGDLGPWPSLSPQEMPDPETLNFLAAWRRIYSPLPSGFWPPDSSSHSQVPVGKSDQPFSTPSPGSPSAFDVLGQSPIAAPISDGWQRSTPQTSLQPDRAGNFTSPAEALNSANYWNGAPTPPRMNAGPMPDSRYPLLPTMIAPTWDAVTSRATVRPAELVPEPPKRSSWNAPAGTPDPAPWMSSSESKNDPRVLSDATPDNDWIPGADYVADGHHEYPRANYKKMPLETRKVFDEAKTGRLFVHSINGRRHVFDAFHRQYNAGTKDLLNDFMRENNIPDRPDLMTPSHAHRLLQAIAESEDPRIQSYRNFIRLFKLFPWLRSGARGSE